MRFAKAARLGIPLLLVLMSATAVLGQQDAATTPAAGSSMQPVPTVAAGNDSAAPASMAASTPSSVPPAPAASTETERTVVTNPSDAGKWGWLGLLGLLGLMGLRRREGEVTVVDRTVPRSTVPPIDPGPPVNRR